MDVLEDIKGNVDQLPEPARELYRTATNKQLQERLSSTFGKLMTTRLETIQDIDIRNALEFVVQNERCMVDAGQRRHRRAETVDHDTETNEQPRENQQPAEPRDHRDQHGPEPTDAQDRRAAGIERHVAGPRDARPVGQQDRHVAGPPDARPAGQHNRHDAGPRDARPVAQQDRHVVIPRDARPVGQQDRHVAGARDARPASQQDRHDAGPRDARPVGQQDLHILGPRDARPAGQQDRHVARLHAAGPAVPRDRRDAAAALLSDSDSDHENAGQAPRRPKRRLVDVMKENHELYNKFMKTKMPKILRELGISSDSE